MGEVTRGRNRQGGDLGGLRNDPRGKQWVLGQEGAPASAWLSQEIVNTLSGYIYLSCPWHTKGVGKGAVWARGLIWKRDDSSPLNRWVRLNGRVLANKEMSPKASEKTALSSGVSFLFFPFYGVYTIPCKLLTITIVCMTAVCISWGRSRCSINISLNWGRRFSSPVCISVRSAKTSFGCNRFSTWRALPQLKRKETTNEEKLQQEEQDERGTHIFIPTGNNCLEIA